MATTRTDKEQRIEYRVCWSASSNISFNGEGGVIRTLSEDDLIPDSPTANKLRELQGEGDTAVDGTPRKHDPDGTPLCFDCGKRQDQPGIPAICSAWHRLQGERGEG